MASLCLQHFVLFKVLILYYTSGKNARLVHDICHFAYYTSSKNATLVHDYAIFNFMPQG